MASGWLQSPARGVYLRKGGKPTWEGLLHTLQSLEQLPLYVGGRFALARQGHEHYLRLGEPATLTLYGPSKLPAWSRKLPLRERVQACGNGPFDWALLAFSAESLDATLNAQGLERVMDATSAVGVVYSTPERAIGTLRRETRQRPSARSECHHAWTFDPPAATRQHVAPALQQYQGEATLSRAR